MKKIGKNVSFIIPHFLPLLQLNIANVQLKDKIISQPETHFKGTHRHTLAHTGTHRHAQAHTYQVLLFL